MEKNLRARLSPPRERGESKHRPQLRFLQLDPADRLQIAGSDPRQFAASQQIEDQLANRRTDFRAELLAVAVGFGTHTLHNLGRSEEHTSELQSHLNLVCRLLLEKKKKI